MTDISKNVQTLIKKAYHVPSTYHNTKWYNETSHIYQNTFEANDINVQTVPTTPVWSDVSYSESSLYELGIAITTSDSFAVTDASFIETISGDVYYDDYQKSPGAYIDSTGTVMLFVRLKLDKMITDSENSDYGVDTNAIAYVKYGASNLILNGSFEEGATDVNGYEFSSATGGVPNWTTDVSDRVVFIEDGNNAWSSGDDVVATYDDDWLIGLQYKDTSISQTVGNLEAGSYNISFAVAARNHVYTTSPFLFEVKNANSGEILVDLSDTSVIAWTYKTFSFDITSHNTDITVTFTNNHSIAYDNDDDDRTVFFDSVELKKQTPCSILSNSYQYNYNTQLDVSGVSDTISVFKPYNYKLEYSEDSGNTFLTSLANSVGNWAFDFKSGIVTFGNDPSDDVPSIDISNGDLYFTFVKYVGLRGVNNLDTINGDLTVGGKIEMNGTDFVLWNASRGGGDSTSSGRALVHHTIDSSAYSKANSILCINYNSDFGAGTKVNGNLGVGITPTYALDVYGTANISSDLTVGGDTDISGDLVVSKSVSVTNADENTYTSDNLLSFGEDDLSPTLRWSKSDAENCGVAASRTPSTLILTPVNYNDGFIEFYMGRSWSGDRNNNRGTTFRHYRDANFAGNDGASHSPDRLDIFVSGDNGHSNGTSTQTVDATPNITFTADNYVGINTKQPTYGLHVETEAYISSDLTVGGTVNSTNTILDATNVTSKTLTLIGGSSSSYEYKQASYFHAGDKTYGYGLIKTSGNDTFGFCVNADDDSPNSLLEIDLNGSMAVAKDLTVGGSLQLDGNFTIGDGTETEYIYMYGTSSSTLKLSAFNGRVDIKHSNSIAFSIDSTLVDGTGEIMRITSTGLGIGETSPGYPLHVDDNGGSVTGYYLDTKGDKDLYNTDVDDGDDNADVYKDTNEALSIYSSGSVGINSGKYYYLSDERIKTNIRDISDDEALVAFRKLQPKTYNYKDPLKSGYNSVYGFIAQEVAEVIPNSTMKDTGFIPNIYRACEIDNSINILTFHFGTSGETIEQFDLSINDIIQIEDVNKNMIERTIIDIIDDYSIQVNDEYIPAHTHDSSGIELSYNQVFVYGKRIDDLHRLGKDSIWTVAAAALQEVDRQQQADKVRISELESEVTTLKNQVSTFETQMSELLARVSAMENNNSTTTTDVSDNTTTTDGS